MREEKNEIFRCGICNKPYPTAYERNKCEYACLKKADERAKILKNAEKEKKRREIDRLVAEYNQEFHEQLNIDLLGTNYYVDHVSVTMSPSEFKQKLTEALKYGSGFYI